jgi:hypothetical protein
VRRRGAFSQDKSWQGFVSEEAEILDDELEAIEVYGDDQVGEETKFDSACFPTWLLKDSADSAAPAEQSATLVDRKQAEAFARLLFEGMSGFAHLRGIASVPAPGAPPPYERWYTIDDALPGIVGDYVEMCAANGYAAYLIPHPVTENSGGLTGILTQRVIPVDIDKGDIQAKVDAIVALLGKPWLTIHSGGVEDGQPKVHLYFRLADDAGPDSFERVKAARLLLATRFGGDTKVGKNPAQILRCPGSQHEKPNQGTAACRLIEVVPSQRVALKEFERLLGSPEAGTYANPFDFNNVNPSLGVSMERVLTQSILADGKSEDGLTRFDAAGSALGHYIRNMRDPAVMWSEAEARQAARDWNAAEMKPQWENARLMGDFDRLLRRDIARNGPLPVAQAPQSKARAFKLSEWTEKEYAGVAPAQRWLIDHVFPLGEAGILAGDGGIGKSFLALDMCYRVAAMTKPPMGFLDFTQQEIFGGHIMEGGSAVFITAEESKDALHRRLDALAPNRQRDNLSGRLCVVSLREFGGGGSFIGGRQQGYQMTDYARDVLAELKTKPDLRLAVFDPLSVFYGAEGNDRTGVQAFANVLTHMASETDATILALHHMRKDNEGSARKSILGSSGFVDAFRFAYTLQKVAPGKEENTLAADYGLGAERGDLVKGELVKTNGAAEGDYHLYERQANGVLRQLPRRIDIAKATRDEHRARLVEAVDWYANYGQPFTRTGRGSGLYANLQSLPPELRGLSQRRLEMLADEAVLLGELQTAAAGKEKRQVWLCKPGSVVAEGRLRDFTAGARPAWEARELR